MCLTLFTRSPSPHEVVRHISLDVVNNAVQTQKLDEQSLSYIKESLMGYIQQRYTGSSEVDSANLQNKLTQTLTYLFSALYSTSWTSFFDDFIALGGDASGYGATNPSATILYLRIIRSIHDEIADLLIPRSVEESKRNTDLKDLVRARDAGKIAASWVEILSRSQQIDMDIVELCLKCVSRWVGWIDISLVVNENMLRRLWELAGQQGIRSSDSKEGRVRDAAIDTFTEIVAKKMPPSDKIELVRYLNLTDVIGQLAGSPALSEYRSTSNYDTDLGETVAKLTNSLMNDIVKVLDTEGITDTTRSEAENLLQICMPYLLRFFSDEYDEICSTVIPSMTDLLTMFRKRVKSSGSLPAHHSAMLQPMLDSIITKMKYDDTAEWGEEDEQTDEAEFQELRKRLHVLQQTVAAVDETLYMETLSRLVATTFNRVDASDSQLTWRDLDLALYEIYLFGELAVKNAGLYQKSQPTNVASQHLVEMMSKLVNSSMFLIPRNILSPL